MTELNERHFDVNVFEGLSEDEAEEVASSTLTAAQLKRMEVLERRNAKDEIEAGLAKIKEQTQADKILKPGVSVGEYQAALKRLAQLSSIINRTWDQELERSKLARWVEETMIKRYSNNQKTWR